MSPSLVVFLKEVRENLRDRRTLINSLLTGPLMAPLFFVLIINASVNREMERAEKVLTVPVIGAEHAPNLVAALKRSNVEIAPAPADAEQAIRDQENDIILRIPSNYAEAWNKGEPAQIELLFDASRQDANALVQRVRSTVENYAGTIGAQRLMVRGIAPTVGRPIVIASRDQSTPQSRSGIMFAILPYFFILGAFMGGMPLAIDTTAGERERQSLEPLLINPVPRWKIIVGKLTATSSFAMTTVFLGILAFAVAGKLMPTERLGITLDFGPQFIASTLFVMVPLAIMLASLQTFVAAFARSFREAQTYLAILTFVPVVPTMLMVLYPTKTQLWMFATPLIGQHVSILGFLRGDPIAFSSLLICFVTTSIAALLFVLMTAKLYQSERVAITG
ncbi:MAG: ABC transporter permease [Dokdonella sp.]